MGNSKKERPVSTYCDLTGHIADRCYKLHGYPSDYKTKGNAFMVLGGKFLISPNRIWGSQAETQQ